MILTAAAPIVVAAMLSPLRVGAVSMTECAPISALTQKAVVFGNHIANPLVPALLVSSIQQNLTASYGRLRTDRPLFWVGTGAGKGDVPVLPCVEGVAQFTLNHPGSTRHPDGSVQLLAAEGRPDEMVVVFDKNDGYAAFALSAVEAKAALDATASARKAAVTHAGEPLARVDLDEKTFLSYVGPMTSVSTNGIGVVSQISGLSAKISIDGKGVSLTAEVRPKAGVTPEELCANLDKSFGASLKAFGASEGVRPECRFTPSEGKVKARLSLSAAELKKAGKAFNKSVVQAMSARQES